MDEVRRGSDDDAEGERVLEQEDWMGGDLWRSLDFAPPGTVTSERRDMEAERRTER